MDSNTLVIDAVFTWVNGNESVHQEKMSGYLSTEKAIKDKSVALRFYQINEIEYAVKSILKYAKIIRDIITDNQNLIFLKWLHKKYDWKCKPQ